jgi:hypothetical protein
MQRPEWTRRAEPAVSVNADIGFLIRESYYYGPENSFTQEQWNQLREPLYQPKVAQFHGYVLSAELAESASELVTYYLDVVRLCARHQKDIARQKTYFWIRPLIFAGEEFAITFPWYDTWAESAPVLDALATLDDGPLYDDVDQGWEFQAFAESGILFLRQADPDSNKEHVVIATDHLALADRVQRIGPRVARVLTELTAALGRDFWSKRWI